jgi:hypothetical protein
MRPVRGSPHELASLVSSLRVCPQVRSLAPKGVRIVIAVAARNMRTYECVALTNNVLVAPKVSPAPHHVKWADT